MTREERVSISLAIQGIEAKSVTVIDDTAVIETAEEQPELEREITFCFGFREYIFI